MRTSGPALNRCSAPKSTVRFGASGGSSGDLSGIRRPDLGRGDGGRHMDAGILIILVVMICFGLVMLFSASMTLALQTDRQSAWYYVGRQMVFSALGFGLLALLTRHDIRRLASIRTLKLFCGTVTVLLILVLIPRIGVNINNQQRWLPLPFNMTFQPSEFAKLTIVFGGGCYYPWLNRERRKGRLAPRNPRYRLLKDFFMDMGLPILVVGFWCFLILRQSHFSAALILVCELGIVFLAAGISRSSWRILLLFIGSLLGLALLIFALFNRQIIDFMLNSRRMSHIINRLASFKGAVNDTSYQPMQAMIAIGSGGLTGVGLGMGVQKYNYLPEAHNDYVYAIICEELGFIGGVLVLLLFAFYCIRGLRIAGRAQTPFGQIAGTGFASLITLQALLSIAVNLQVIPSTGVSLPFFSYGGTSNLFFMVGIGILLNISKFGTAPPAGQDTEAAGRAAGAAALPKTMRIPGVPRAWHEEGREEPWS